MILTNNYTFSGLGVSIVGLERALLHYTKEPTITPFDIKTVPIDTAPLVPKQSKGLHNFYQCSGTVCGSNCFMHKHHCS